MSMMSDFLDWAQNVATKPKAKAKKLSDKPEAEETVTHPCNACGKQTMTSVHYRDGIKTRRCGDLSCRNLQNEK